MAAACAPARWSGYVLPIITRAQERVGRVAVLMYTTSDEPESQARITALAQGLQEAGWSVGRNLRIDVRWSGGDFARLRKDAEELVGLAPDVLIGGIPQPALPPSLFERVAPKVATPAARKRVGHP